MGVTAGGVRWTVGVCDAEAEAEALRRLTMDGAGLSAGVEDSDVNEGSGRWKDCSWLTNSRWSIEWSALARLA